MLTTTALQETATDAWVELSWKLQTYSLGVNYKGYVRMPLGGFVCWVVGDSVLRLLVLFFITGGLVTAV